MYDYAGVALLGENKLIVQRHSLSMGDEIYSIDLADNNKVAQLTTENKQIYDQLAIGKVEGRWMKTTDGKQMLTWVIYPLISIRIRNIRPCCSAKEVLKAR